MHHSWYRFIGPVCLNVYTLAGPWFSLGFHISFRPLYFDLHLLWFCITVMSRARGQEIHACDYLAEEMGVYDDSGISNA